MLINKIAAKNSLDEQLLDACSKTNVAHVIGLLKEGADPNACDYYSKSRPLHKAVSNGNLQISKVLIEFGTNPDIKNIDDTTPLHHAAINGHCTPSGGLHRQIVEYLLKLNVNQNAKNRNGSTPLHYAVRSCYINVTKLLLNTGSDPNIQNEYGNTALHVACYHGMSEIVELLLDAGANLKIRDRDEQTPETVALESGFINIVNYLQEWPSIQQKKKLEALVLDKDDIDQFSTIDQKVSRPRFTGI